jgi:hypothetical protein
MTNDETLDKLRSCVEIYEDAANKSREIQEQMEGMLEDLNFRKSGNVEYLLNLLFGISREMAAAARDGSVTRDDAARWAADIDRITDELCGDPDYMRRIRL